VGYGASFLMPRVGIAQGDFQVVQGG
jgi:hypothetical protein